MTQAMSPANSAQEVANREASPEGCPIPANSVVKGIRRFWAGIRCLKAELLAIPIRTRRTAGNLIVIADLPGIKKEQVRVELTESVLVIDAEPNRAEEDSPGRSGRRILPL